MITYANDDFHKQLLNITQLNNLKGILCDFFHLHTSQINISKIEKNTSDRIGHRADMFSIHQQVRSATKILIGRSLHKNNNSN